MLKIKNYAYFCAIYLFLYGLGAKANEQNTTGVIQEISKNHIELALPTEISGNINILSIGFTCEPNIYDSIEKFSVGDEVLITLGAVNRKNKLLLIKKCQQEDKSCQQAKVSQGKREKEQEKLYQQSIKEEKKCQNSMEKDLSNDIRYIYSKSIHSTINKGEDIISKYNAFSKNPTSKKCLEEVISLHQKALYESCIKYGCDNTIGGGCAHIVGYSVTTKVISVALKKCGS